MRRPCFTIPAVSSSVLALILCCYSPVIYSSGPQAAQLPAAQSATQPGNSPQTQWPAIPGSPQSSPNIHRPPSPIKDMNIGGPLSRRQKDAIVAANFKKTQQDVAKLSKLVQTLQKQMQKSSPDVLSVAVWKQVNKIEKLARTIKGETKLY
jgi:hypothetical protein